MVDRNRIHRGMDGCVCACNQGLPRVGRVKQSLFLACRRYLCVRLEQPKKGLVSQRVVYLGRTNSEPEKSEKKRTIIFPSPRCLHSSLLSVYCRYVVASSVCQTRDKSAFCRGIFRRLLSCCIDYLPSAGANKTGWLFVAFLWLFCSAGDSASSQERKRINFPERGG